MPEYIAPSDYEPSAAPTPAAASLSKVQKDALLAALEAHLDGEPALREDVIHFVERRLRELEPAVYVTGAQAGALIDEWVASEDLQSLASPYAAAEHEVIP